jgi:glycerol dehydrogenase
MTIRAFGGPHRYIQGPGALSELATLVPLYGKRPFVVVDVAVIGALREQLAVAQALRGSRRVR